MMMIIIIVIIILRTTTTAIIIIISVATSDAKETAHLFQRLSIALQRFNAVCVIDSFGIMSDE